MLRSGSLLVAASVVFGAIGLAVSYLITPPLGADHSCPAGSPPTACHYPADQTGWSIWWTIGGLIAGLFIGLIARGFLSRRAH